MRGQKLFVSIVMPAYNAESTIRYSIASVCSQTFPNWELLILDDGSVDHTYAEAQKFADLDQRIRLFKEIRNRGVPAVRNHGIALAKGDYIAFLDSDDTWHPDKLRRQLDCIQRTGAQLCYTSYALVSPEGRKVRADYLVPEQLDLKHLLRENFIGCSTVMLSAKVARMHPFRTDFYHEDYVLWLELLQAGYKAVGCREVLTNWCYQENSRSYNKFRSMKNRWRVYRKALKLSLPVSIGYLSGYALAGIRKYRK